MGTQFCVVVCPAKPLINSFNTAHIPQHSIDGSGLLFRVTLSVLRASQGTLWLSRNALGPYVCNTPRVTISSIAVMFIAVGRHLNYERCYEVWRLISLSACARMDFLAIVAQIKDKEKSSGEDTGPGRLPRKAG